MRWEKAMVTSTERLNRFCTVTKSLQQHCQHHQTFGGWPGAVDLDLQQAIQAKRNSRRHQLPISFPLRQSRKVITLIDDLLLLLRSFYLTNITTCCLITVGVGLVGAIDGDANVLGLLSREDGEPGTKGVKVEAGDLLVELLGEDVNLAALVLVGVALLPEFDLGEGLVGEGAGHDEGGVAGGAAKVEKASLGENDDTVALLEDELVNLGLNVHALGDLHEAIHVDLVVEVTDVSDDGVVLHLAHGLGHEDALVTGGGDEDVGGVDDVLKGADGVTLHAGLKGADGVNLGNVNDAAVGAHGGGAALSDVTVAADDGLLTGHHNIGGAHDTIGEGVLAAVKVVELGLGDGVVDVDSGEEEGPVLLHGVKTVDTGGGLLGDTMAAAGDLVPLVGLAGLEKALEDGEDNLELGVVGGLGVGEGAVLKEEVLGLLTLVDDEGHVTAVIDDDVGSVALAIILLPGEGVKGALPVLLEGLSLPGEDSGGLVAGDGGGGVVLGGEDVARAPADVATEGLEGLDEDGGLDGHVEGAGDTGTLEVVGVVLLAAGHETGHLNLGNLNLLAAIIGKGDVSNCCKCVGLFKDNKQRHC
jgi:hypothetical protein